MPEEMESGAPSQVEQTEQEATQVEQQEGSEATTEQAQQTEQEQQEQADKKTPWFQKRISEVTREKYEAKRQAEQYAAEVQALREQMARYSTGDEQPQTDVEQLAHQKAAEIVAARSFDEKCNKVYAEGKSSFQDFDAAIGNLQMVGVSRQFLELATDSDAAAKLLHHLGQDLDEASRIASLSPVQMARELTRLEYKLNQPSVKPVSKAPAPIKPIGSGKVSDSGLSDDLPMDEWLRRRNEQLRRR